MFQNDGSGHLKSTISSDGITWTLEPGIRLTQDTTSIYERGNFALQLVSFVTLPNGSIRMYYEGGVVAGSTGTPAWYQNYTGSFSSPLFFNGAILSAVSTDGGLTWVKDPGVRISQLVQGPAIQFTGPTPGGLATSTQYDGSDVTSVAVTENGKTVYRIYAPTVTNGAASYVSSDGLTFSLEGQIPSVAGDPKAFVLPDGRVWLITNQYPDAFADTLVYGPQSFTVNSVHAAIQKVPATNLPGFRVGHDRRDWHFDVARYSERTDWRCHQLFRKSVFVPSRVLHFLSRPPVRHRFHRSLLSPGRQPKDSRC